MKNINYLIIVLLSFIVCVQMFKISDMQETIKIDESIKNDLMSEIDYRELLMEKYVGHDIMTKQEKNDFDSIVSENNN
ncbi:hypothetical protein [Bacillus pumilus]|uniref:hypothetical protein n=1 Tax=Bacillus pumilus TaxID=1408 RepID=UPI0011A861F2|nr:hypothetical protein [Bacillus pumilus]